jgi:hypothetical protein
MFPIKAVDLNQMYILHTCCAPLFCFQYGLLSYHITTEGHNPGDSDLNLHYPENFHNTRSTLCVKQGLYYTVKNQNYNLIVHITR